MGIIGHPVGHSRSPAMQNAALRALALDYVYVPFPVQPECLGAAVAGLRALGVVGFNVTIPYKEKVIPFLDQLDRTAEIAGAVNTVANRDGALIGYNTDGDGFVSSLWQDLAFLPEGKRVVLLGAGGAARGALAALCRSGVGRVVLANRTLASAESLAACMHEQFPATEIVVTGLGQLAESLEASDLLVNTTSVGMNDDHYPGLDVKCMSHDACVYDMVYAPPFTPLLTAATQRGLRCANGLGMLACQGELAFRIWTGSEPPQGLMKSVLTGI